jgi:hypothetical protein
MVVESGVIRSHDGVLLFLHGTFEFAPWMDGRVGALLDVPSALAYQMDTGMLMDPW